ncbi:hypothetical protein LCGC14_2677670 [marine sediment metagenome]|uniref:Uncharacterized protein n=1 Tax=marine sediment metagenome TaxID=412755 RepID=A0A0F9CE37_9ZZZZ
MGASNCLHRLPYPRENDGKVMKKLALALVLVLSACTNLSPARQVLVACQGYASTLTVLAARKAAGRLSLSQIELVNTLRPGLNTICLEGKFTDPTVAYNLVQDSMFKLIEVEVTTQ